MKNLIKKVQKKPRSTRLLILWLGSFLVMAIIIAIWLASFSRSNFQEAEVKIEGSNLPSLFESIEKDFSIFKQKLEASLKEIRYEEGEQE